MIHIFKIQISINQFLLQHFEEAKSSEISQFGSKKSTVINYSTKNNMKIMLFNHF